MSQRSIAFYADPIEANEAPGVTIKRSIGSERLVLLDPLLLLDHLFVEPDPAGGVIGFPRHPHRGIETLTVVLKGRVNHRDSLGNNEWVGPGATQWMTAGNGIWHAEMLEKTAEGTEAVQFWFNVPESAKRKPAGYRAAYAEDVPHWKDGSGNSVHLLAGVHEGSLGPLDGLETSPYLVRVESPAGATWTWQGQEADTALVYLLSGSISIADRSESKPGLYTLSKGSELTVIAGAEGAEYLFIAAAPLQEPVMQYRSFVMNTVEDIGETLGMIADGSFADGGGTPF